MSLYSVIRPLLFRLDEEWAHTVTLKLLEFYSKLPKFLKLPKPTLPSIPVNAMGLHFQNPIGAAAGLDKNGDFIHGLTSLGFGFLELGTVTPIPQDGNPKPRIFRLPEAQAVINHCGFNNKGCDYLAKRIELAKRSGYNGIIGVNIGKHKITSLEDAHLDYLKCFRQVRDSASYVVINVSSPNTPSLRQLQSDHYLRGILERLLDCRETDHDATKKPPILVKVSPDMDEDAMVSIAATVRDIGIEGLIVANTTLQKTAVAALPYGNQEGGLSGAPLRERTVGLIQRFRSLLPPPCVIIGVGGINAPDHARQFFDAGADLVQIYSGIIYEGPELVPNILRKLSAPALHCAEICSDIV